MADLGRASPIARSSAFRAVEPCGAKWPCGANSVRFADGLCGSSAESRRGNTQLCRDLAIRKLNRGIAVVAAKPTRPCKMPPRRRTRLDPSARGFYYFALALASLTGMCGELLMTLGLPSG